MRILYIYEVTFEDALCDKKSSMCKIATEMLDKLKGGETSFHLPAVRMTEPAVGTFFRDCFTHNGLKEFSIFEVKKVEVEFREGYVIADLGLQNTTLTSDLLLRRLNSAWFQWKEVEQWAMGKEEKMPIK